jgi:autotransporter-associated beta strand protein
MSFIDVSVNWIPLGWASNYKNSLQPVINLANSGMSIGTLQSLFNSQLNTNGNYLAVSKFDVSSNTTLIVDTSNGGGLFSSFIKDGSGTLQLNIAGNSFACDISHNNGLLNFNTYGDCIYYSKLSGAGTINKNGSGNLTIINDNTNYTGTINVNSGRLTVNGILSSSSNIIVNNGATLTGSGTVGNVTICTSGNIISTSGTNGLTINAVSCLQPLVAGDGIAISYNTNNSAIVALDTPIWVKVTSGYAAFFGYTSINRVYGWGNGYMGNGYGAGANYGFTECVCGTDSGNTLILDMVTIFYTTYVLFSNGNLYGWGNNTRGQLGIASAVHPQLTPIIIKTNVSKLIYRPYEQHNYTE